MFRLRLILFWLLTFTYVVSFGQSIWFTPNVGQWESAVEFKTNLVSGSFYAERDGFTYHLHNFNDLYHANHGHEEHDLEETFKGQVVRSKFVGSSVQKISGEKKSTHYSNFFIGSDSTKWKSKVFDVASIRYQELYKGISMQLRPYGDHLKYDLIVRPEGDPSDVEIEYLGMNELYLDESGNLIVKTDFGDIKESKPIVYQEIQGKKVYIHAAFELTGNTVRFKIGAYDEQFDLVIDPELTFSSFTGSTADNWGYTATPDTNGNLYAGGVVFGSGYPFITGSYDGSYNGGSGNFGIDMGISKFNASGSTLMYSTYIGGSANESPHSLVVNEDGELYILGSTGSLNYPTTPGAYQTQFAQGGGLQVVGNVLEYVGSDIVVTKMSADGSVLAASTYIGGSGHDGLSTSTPLRFNYGDDFRGEIVVDENSNVYVASTSRSGDFPMQNAFDNSLGGIQDGVVFKFDPNLTNLDFSSYIGGAALDASYSVQLSNAGDIFVAGGTTSSDLPGTSGALNSAFMGGTADGYVSKIDGSTFSLVRTSYLGTSSYNQAYFVQLDLDDDVYVLGQSDNGYPVSGSVYNNSNSGQFIHKLTNDLTTTIWSTAIGAGTGNVEISPTAFLVSDCYDIFISGWGGVTNSSNSLAVNSSSNGFPLTPDAYQTSTTGNNFYLAVLDRDAAFLKYATYFGGMSSSTNHVDGGTSRFDKKGSIYHAVCASCGSLNNGFTSTPGAWSTTAQSNNCNLAAFKFDLGIIESAISVPEPFICIPNPIEFNNDSENGNAFFWDFGDNTTSTEVSPSHVYTDTGTYVVTLITIDTLQCFSSDTSEVVIQVSEFQGAVIIPQNTYCPGDTVQLEATGGSQFQWSPANLVSNPSIANPTAIVTETTNFSVIVSDTCGTDTLSFTVNVFDVTGEAFGDTIICLGSSIQISAVDAATYLWSPAEYCDDPQVQTPTVTPTETTDFIVEMTTNDGCQLIDTVRVEVELDKPIPDIPDLVSICKGYAMQVPIGGEFIDSYLWSPDYNISDINSSAPIITGEVDTIYVIGFFNVCGAVYDSIAIDVIEIEAEAWNDTIVCPGDPAIIYASGGVSYTWFPAGTVSTPDDSMTYVTPQVPTNYGVQVVDQFGCIDTAYVFVDHFPLPWVIASPDFYGFIGDTIPMSASAGGLGDFLWSPNEYLSCDTCSQVTSYTENNMSYTVTFTDENGCTASDVVNIYFDGILYVPNAFTPNGDGFNDLFRAEGGNINEFYLGIFNRWGELIFESEDMDIGWDGKYKGKFCQDGVYVWKIVYSDAQGTKKALHGHVVLLR